MYNNRSFSSVAINAFSKPSNRSDFPCFPLYIFRLKSSYSYTIELNLKTGSKFSCIPPVSNEIYKIVGGKINHPQSFSVRRHAKIDQSKYVFAN
jgi:hypothetical protein